MKTSRDAERRFPDREDIRAVVRFLDVVEPPTEGLAELVGSEPREDDVITLPHWAYAPAVHALRRAFYDHHFVVGFDWPSWQGEAARLHESPEALAEADLTDLVKLITTHLRKERFVDGHFAAMLENGGIAAILRRLKEIDEILEISPERIDLIADREGLGEARR